MTSLLIAYTLVLLVPLFVSSWRLSLAGLASQGALLYAMVYHLDGFALSGASFLRLVDLLGFRAVLGPLLLYRTLADRKVPGRNDVLPPNMLAWAGAIGFVILSFRLGGLLVPSGGDGSMVAGVVASSVLLGFLVLATQLGVFSQVVAVLRVENAIVLLELDEGGEAAFGLQVLKLGVYAGTLGFCWWYLATIVPAAPPPEPVLDEDDE